MANNGSIILLDGASSSGKSTLSRAMQAQEKEPLLHFSMDHLLAACILPGNRFESGEFSWASSRESFFDGFHRCIAALAAAGNNVIVEHIVETDAWMLRLLRLLATFDVFFVAVRCSLVELERRERARGDRRIGDACRDFAVTHTFGIYDCEVNTAEPAHKIAGEVLAAWYSRKDPSAFEQMGRYRNA